MLRKTLIAFARGGRTRLRAARDECAQLLIPDIRADMRPDMPADMQCMPVAVMLPITGAATALDQATVDRSTIAAPVMPMVPATPMVDALDTEFRWSVA